MRKRLMLAVVAMSLLVVALVQPSSVGAQSPLDQARDDLVVATDRLEQHLNDLAATQARGDALAATYWQVVSGVERLDLDIAASTQATGELAIERDELRAEVRVVALDQYVGQSEDLSAFDYASDADRTAAEALARLVIGADNSAIDQLAAVDEAHEQARSRLEVQRLEQLDALAEVEATQAALAQELARLGELREELDSERAELDAALIALEQIEAERQAAADERARIDEERRRAEAAAAAAAELERQPPTPAPTAVPTATAVPNPQLPEVTPEPSATPQPDTTVVPNPQPSEPFPTTTPQADTTVVPNPQLPEVTPEPDTTVVPNPQPSEPFPTPVPNPQPPEPATTAVPSGGGIVCPLNGPFTHTDDFNAPRAVGGVHRANDLISPQGTPVLAVASGTIEHRDSRVGGMSAHLKGDNGDYYFYTHLSGYENVGAGRVAAGAVIGYVGMTGNAPIPHLHFEIHRGGYGNYTNPYGPVRNACF